MWRKRNYTKRGESAIDTRRGERRFENLNFHRNLHYLNSGERAITQNVANAQLLKTWRMRNYSRRGERNLRYLKRGGSVFLKSHDLH